MKYKLVCIDMDGTLLSARHKVSDENKASIKKAHDLGVQIVIATGRIYNNAKHYSNLIGVKSPVISANGALVMDKVENKIIYKKTLSPESCYKIVEVLDKHKIIPHFHSTDKIYTGNKLHKFISGLALSWNLPKELKVQGVCVKNMNEWKNIIENEEEIFKCIVFNNSREKLKRARNDLEKIEEIEVASSSNNNLEINAKGVSKGEAVKALAKYYNIACNEVICIGDNENDISMIEIAGMGVAMGNANIKVKEKADYVTDTNSNSGVAKVINKFIVDNNFDL